MFLGQTETAERNLQLLPPHSCQSELPEPECDFKQTKFYEDHIARSEPIGMATFEVRSELLDDFCWANNRSKFLWELDLLLTEPDLLQ